MCFPDPLDTFIILSVSAVNTVFFLCCIGMILVGALITTSINTYYNSLTAIILEAMVADSTAMLAMGIIGIIFAFMLYLTLCCSSRDFVIAMTIFYFLYMLAILALIIIYAALITSVQTQMEALWLNNLQAYYQDPGNAALSNTYSYDYYWNYLMYTLQCCGAQSYTDYYNATRWIRTYTYVSNNVYTTVYNATIPVWCCQMQTTTFAIRKPYDWTCVLNPTVDNSNYDVNCEDALYTAVHNTEFTTASIVLAVIAFVMVAIIVAALIVALVHHKWDFPETIRNPKQPLRSQWMNPTVRPSDPIPPIYVERTKPIVRQSFEQPERPESWYPETTSARVVYAGAAPYERPYDKMPVVNVK